MNAEIINLLEQSNNMLSKSLTSNRKINSISYLSTLNLYGLLSIEDNEFFVSNYKKFQKNIFFSAGILLSSLPTIYFLKTRLNIPYNNSFIIISPFFLLIPIYLLYKNFRIEQEFKNMSLIYFKKVALFFATGNIFELNEDFLKIKTQSLEIEKFKEKLIQNSGIDRK